MEHRMKKHQLTLLEIVELFKCAQVGRIATINEDGSPYIVPVHFVYHDNKIYIHGLNKGQKLANIKRNAKVCFEIDEMKELILDKLPCDTNTDFESIISLGYARMVDDYQQKLEILKLIVEKYTPHLKNFDLPEKMVKGTSVIEIIIQELTGKYYK